MTDNSISAASGRGDLKAAARDDETRAADVVLANISAFVSHIAKLLRYSAGATRRRRRQKSLTDLNNHLLRDIGLEREDTGTAHIQPEWRDPLDVEARRLG
ncbi:MAG: hypothetical protein GY933_25460 [Hyphomicrobiales bacterium]|nr:hypothetical protein [Hyphomicrobiales bacterium]